MDIDRLISEVYLRPSIWDQSDVNHHNRYILDKLWDEIADILKITRVTARNKWKSLRDKFRTTLSSIPKPKSGDGADKIQKVHWQHFNNLLFLKNQFTNRKSSGNFEMNLEKGKDTNEIIYYTETETYPINEIEKKYEVCNAKESVRENEEILSSIEDDEYSRKTNECYSPCPYTSFATPTSSFAPVVKPNISKRRAKDDIGPALLAIETKKMKFLEDKSNKRDEDTDDMHFF